MKIKKCKNCGHEYGSRMICGDDGLKVVDFKKSWKQQKGCGIEFKDDAGYHRKCRGTFNKRLCPECSNSNKKSSSQRETNRPECLKSVDTTNRNEADIQSMPTDKESIEVQKDILKNLNDKSSQVKSNTERCSFFHKPENTQSPQKKIEEIIDKHSGFGGEE